MTNTRGISIPPKANDLAWALTLAACWFWTCNQLSLAWSTYPNYQYGYFVPWIAVLFALRRIWDTPGCLDPARSTPRGIPFLPTLLILTAWALFLFAELVRQFDPHWRIVGWLMMLSVTTLTALCLWRRGGKNLLLLLAFPVSFTWTAVPWPTKLEELVTLSLRAFVTTGAVTAIHLMGIQANQHGNVIDLAGPSVVVDSACSGISSFQVSIMASLFLGEFFRFRPSYRFLLLAAGALCAIAANLIRATLLVWLANAHGIDTLLAWHDRIGYAETAAIFLTLLLAAWLLSQKARNPEPRDRQSPRRRKGQVGDGGRASPDWHPTGSPSLLSSPPPVEGLSALLTFAAIPFITAVWFTLSPGGPIKEQDAPLWLVKSTPTSPTWHSAPVTLSTLDLRTLAFDQAQTISLAGPANAAAVIYHFFWKTDASTGYGHTPDHCMLAAGWEPDGAPVPTTIQLNNTTFPGKFYCFKRDNEEEVVFQSVWYGGDPLLSSGEFPYAKGGPRTSRLAMLWDQPRRRGLESLNVYMPPAPTPEAQTRIAQSILAQVLIPNRP